MRTSRDRILTTHAGSLPRPAELTQLLGKLSRHEPFDAQELERIARDATRDVIRKQIDAGIDVVNNGEQSRESFFSYVQHRMSGFSGKSRRPGIGAFAKYPTLRDLMRREFASRAPAVDVMHTPVTTAEVRYVGRAAVERECDDTLEALADHAARFTEPFMTAPSPGMIANAMQNGFYPDLAAYTDALGEALRVEYETIVGRGFVLQLDCPDLAADRSVFADRPLSEFLAFVDRVIDTINTALRNIERGQVRMHVCWGNYEGPHEEDIALSEILPRLYRANVGALMLSMANPRHEHEYRCFSRHLLPPGMVLIVGVIDTTTNYVEHPEVVADRLERAATAIGDPRRIMAGTDCGFDSAAGVGRVAEEVVWRKMSAMADGARLATERLFT